MLFRSNYTYNGSALGPTTSTNTGSSGAVTYSYAGTNGTVYAASSSRPTNAGSYTAVATLAGDSNYNGATSSAYLFTISSATPVITWASPAAITYGTALSATQLNATSTVAGSFVYNPTNGAVLNAGTNTLYVTLNPTDTNNYTSASNSVSLVGRAHV